MGLGPVDLVTLAEAREAALEGRKLLLKGIDPIEARRAQRSESRAAAAKGVSFKEAARRHIEAQRAGWRNAKHASQWTATLETYAYPVIGDVAVGAVDTAMVLNVLEPIWQAKPETASRVRGRIESVLDWSKARGLRDGDNPAAWRGHLSQLLPPRNRVAKVRHHPAIPWREMPTFMADLRKRTSVSAQALEFTVLNAARTAETTGATWAEIDIEERTWTIPPERMKAQREHRIPLSARAVEILKSRPGERSGFIFPGERKGKPLSNMAMLELMRGMRTDGATVHGARSSFRDWGAEATTYPNEMLELSLAHVVSDKTEKAYRRGDMFERRRQLMEDWATFCASPIERSPKVVAIRGKNG